MNEHSSESLDRAVELVRQAVEERYASGIKSYGASLKPELMRRSFDAFSMEDVGFSKFLPFLELAESRGVLAIHRHLRADVEVTPAGKPPLTRADGQLEQPAPVRFEASSLTRTGMVHVRRDLWNGFVDWTDGLLRAYDRERDRVWRLPMEAAPLEPPEFEQVRKGIAECSSRYVPIEGITLQQQIEWARSFANTILGQLGPLLTFALQSELPLRDFSRAVRQDVRVGRQWSSYRLRQVAGVIEKWMADNGLELAIYSDPAPQVPTQPAVRPTGASGGPSSEEEVRAYLRAAIDRMALGDLLRVWIPVGAVRPDQDR